MKYKYSAKKTTGMWTYISVQGDQRVKEAVSSEWSHKTVFQKVWEAMDKAPDLTVQKNSFEKQGNFLNWIMHHTVNIYIQTG